MGRSITNATESLDLNQNGIFVDEFFAVTGILVIAALLGLFLLQKRNYRKLADESFRWWDN